MGRSRLNPRTVVVVLVAAGCVMIAVGVGMLAGIGWALLTGGALTVAYALVMVDIPTRAAHVAPAVAGARRPERG